MFASPSLAVTIKSAWSLRNFAVPRSRVAMALVLLRLFFVSGMSFFTSEKTHGRNKKQPQQDESHGHARPRHGKIAQRPGAFDGHRQRGRREHALRSRLFRARPVYFFSAQKSQVRSHERLGNRPREEAGGCRPRSVALGLPAQAAQARQGARGHDRHSRFAVSRKTHPRFDRAGKFLRAARRPTARQRLQRANQTRSVLAGARGQRPRRSRPDHRVVTGGAARAGSPYPHAQAYADQARRLSLFEWNAIDFGNAQDRGQYDDHGARLAAEPHDHLFRQSMRRSAPRGQRADQSEYFDHLRYFSALATKRLLRRSQPHRRARTRVGQAQGNLRHGASGTENRLRANTRRRQRQGSAPKHFPSI